MPKQKLKIAVAMSGGVDSSVAAKLLKDQGHFVAGIFLHFWKEEPPPLTKGGRGDFTFENKCCSNQALLDARRVAAKIGMPLYTLNFVKLFKKQVADNFLAEYARGRTPNPCVRCNKSVKLGFLIKEAKKLGFDYVASGHYARLKREFSISNFPPFANATEGKQFSKNKKIIYKLHKAKDKNKDQSYFLYTLNQNELKHLLFPLGNYTKTEVRQMAKRWKLPVAEKKDSQEICFIPEKSHNEFLRRHLKLNPGPIKLLTPQPPFERGARGVIGAHEGLPLYTIGQRKGIKIGGIGPFYAVKMDYKTKTLYVVRDSRDKQLFSDRLTVKNVNWLSGTAPAAAQAVIRYRHPAAACRLKKINRLTYSVKFKEPQRAVTPGQSIVFYRHEEVLGGGIIK